MLQEDDYGNSVLKMNSRKDRLEAERAETEKTYNECLQKWKVRNP